MAWNKKAEAIPTAMTKNNEGARRGSNPQPLDPQSKALTN